MIPDASDWAITVLSPIAWILMLSLLGIQAHLSERQHGKSPKKTAKVLNADFLAAQVAWVGNRR